MVGANANTVLVGDIGGTNARFALYRSGAGLIRIGTSRVAAHGSLGAAIRAYLGGLGETPPAGAALAVAAPVTGAAVRFTNSPWSFEIPALKAELGLDRLDVLNDAAALALGATALRPPEVEQVGGDSRPRDAVKVIVAPGTGLGIGAALPGPDGWRAVAGEGGHAALAAESDAQAEAIQVLRHRFGRASAERALSGPGLENLYAAAAGLDGGPDATPTAEQIVHRLAGPERHAHAAAARDLFGDFLGQVAGDLALSFGARGGVYLAGGALGALWPHLDKRRLRQRFEAKGRFRAYLAAVPLYLMRHPEPALLGLAVHVGQADD